jgi:hypothetical protein
LPGVIERAFAHVAHDDAGSVVATLRCVLGQNARRFEWLDAAGNTLLVAEIGGPGATLVTGGTGRPIAETDQRAVEVDEPVVHLIGSSAVMRSCVVTGHPAWIIDDYGNQERHLVLGCASGLFLHVHLDAAAAIVITEKTRDHATLRTIRRTAEGGLIADRALVQAGERLADVARRCGVTPEALRRANPMLSDAPATGTLIELL